MPSTTMMRSSRPSHSPLNLKSILTGLIFAFLLVLTLKSTLINTTTSPPLADSVATTKTCTNIPSSLSHAVIHYSASAMTPQQTLKEISVTARVLADKSPCNFLVFGLGHDSLMWSALNFGGRTIFLEEDEAWIKQIKRQFPMLEPHHVNYDTKVSQATELMEAGRGPECTDLIDDTRHSMCPLALKGLPTQVYDIQWDLIMVDAPTGYYDEAPGRMSAIYTAGVLARNKKEGMETDVMVHDVNRVVQDNFSKAFLCEGYMRKQEGRLRHFRIPSHRDGTSKPFCPIIP